MVLALASGVALIVAVVVNLQSVVEQRDEQALWVSQRTEQLGARELRRAILDPAFLEQTPEAQGFEWHAGKLVTPEAMGWLIPETADADGGLDALARDLVRRASRATGEEATALWQRALRDPGVHSSARDRLRMQAAWFAHRQGQAEWRDSLLGEIEGTAPPEVRASRLLLLAARDKALPADALQVFGHLDPERAQSLALRLTDHGLAFDQGVTWSKEQAERRKRWVQLLPLEDRFASGSESTWSVLPSGILAVLFPDQSRGVWLERADLIRWAREHVDVPVQLVSSLEPAKVGQRAPASVIPDFVGASLPLQAEDSPTSGPVLLAALVVALAALCGGGAWLALRAAGKEAQAARLKGEFLTTVTHELKTPLAGIRLVAELLADDHVQDPEKRKNYLQALSAESTRLSMLIENVLDLRRMERGERVHDAQLEDLGALVRATVELFEPLLKRSG
ncbi:MAG: histidine kinase dimerization/phospho-acceptor domain-containing protein, partial [Planctomycetota bacterium]|nr:histidine kinase dimerization/phospho-acceptor domain-containing protein [Planctomycetota bacterium]